MLLSAKEAKIPSPAKVLVLGDSGVGRSSLLNQLSAFSFRPDYRITVGLQPAAVKLLVRNQEVHIALWNVASQDRYTYIRSKFFQGAKGVIYVFAVDNQTSFENILNWINEVHSVLGPIPGVIVGNKCDRKEHRCVSMDQANAFAKQQKYGYFETSAATGPDLTSALHALVSEIK